MATLTMAQVKETAKLTALNKLTAALESAGAEKYRGDYHLAIPVDVDGQEVWVKVDLTAANFKDTKVSEAFDPFASQQDYLAEQDVKAKEREAKERAKAEKIARDKARRASKSKEDVDE